jgi:hypothetical protein
MAVSVFSGCGKGLNVGTTPVIQNLLVDIQPCPTDPCTGPSTAGAFVYSATGSAPIEFGATVNSSSGGQKLIPNIELRVSATADVWSPVDGVIASIDKNSSQDDYEITIAHSALSEYHISIDHVTELRVKAGDRVSAGSVIGKPGIWYPNLGIGRVELQMKRGSDFVCPMDFLSTGVKAALQEKMRALLEDWEQVKSNPSLYDEGKMVVPGCLTSVIPDDQA